MTPRFLSGVGAGAMWARSESPRRPYATPGCQTGTTRARRRRQILTNHSHAALPWRVTRAYQSDSSSKWPARQPGADALGNMSTPSRQRLGGAHRPRDRGCPNQVLDGASFQIRGGGAPCCAVEPRRQRHLPRKTRSGRKGSLLISVPAQIHPARDAGDGRSPFCLTCFPSRGSESRILEKAAASLCCARRRRLEGTKRRK